MNISEYVPTQVKQPRQISKLKTVLIFPETAFSSKKWIITFNHHYYTVTIHFVSQNILTWSVSTSYKFYVEHKVDLHVEHKSGLI